MFKIGCAEKMLEVPLFVELYGYGPFAGRRNQGTLEPLYARAFSFFDGEKRVLMLYADTCSILDDVTDHFRAVLGEKFGIAPECITLSGTHTHSAPAMGLGAAPSSGTPDPEYVEYFEKIIMEVAEKAIADEEEIVKAEAGKAPLSEKVGVNRVDPENGLTDSAIRWVRFYKKDGSCKVMIHNHAAHGIACNGGLARLVSSDWMGAANRLMKAANLCEMPLYFQGSAGDINSAKAYSNTNDRNIAETIARTYVEDLKKDFANGVEIPLGKFTCSLEKFDFPTVKQDAPSLRRDAELLREAKLMNFAHRFDEMAILLETGKGIAPHIHDLQVIQMGDLSFFFVPGELFIEPGLEILNGAKAKFPILATLANGNSAYIFSEKNAKNFPSIHQRPEKLFGFYEVYCYMHFLRFKFVDNIADFVVQNLLKLEK